MLKCLLPLCAFPSALRRLTVDLLYIYIYIPYPDADHNVIHPPSHSNYHIITVSERSHLVIGKVLHAALAYEVCVRLFFTLWLIIFLQLSCRHRVFQSLVILTLMSLYRLFFYCVIMLALPLQRSKI